MSIQVGDTASRTFTVDEAAMSWFRDVSQDESRIHCDRDYAVARGYADTIVYGGIMLAHLSHLLGMKIPGPSATSLAWSIKFHEALYVGETAEISIKVTYVSSATGVVEAAFAIVSGSKKVASGTTQSLLPLDTLPLG